MSLKIWLPLDGDLRNLGCSNPTITNNSTTINDAGKIGKCYYFNGTDARISLSSLTYTYPLSICAWIKGEKMTSTATQYIVSYNTTASGTSGHRIGFGMYGGKLSIWHGGTYTSYETSLSNNIWYHVAATVTSSGYKLYLNGEEIMGGSRAEPEVSSIWFTLGARSNSDTGGAGGASYYFKGYMNDVRVYNHCLSPLEVKEIAQGLILHYKLDNPYNLNLTTVNKYDRPYSDGEMSTSTFTKTKLVNERGWKYTLNYIGNGNNYWPYCRVPNFSFTPGKTYYYSAKIRCNTWTAGTLALQASRSNNDWTTESVVVCDSDKADSQWHEYYIYQTINNTYERSGTTVTCDPVLEFYCSNLNENETIYNFDFDIKDIQVVESDNYMPFIENSYLSNAIEDSSGYGHNGTIINTITISSDTPRYDNCFHISAVNQKVQINNIITSGFKNSYSFSWWGKCSTFSKTMQWGFSDGVRLNGIYNGNLWNTGDSSQNPLYKPGTTTQVTAPSTGIWHHFVMTGDGTSCKVYKDGEYWGIAKTYKSISGTSIYLNGWNSSTSYSNSDLSLSDFRIYCTPLLDTDIKLLYNNSMRIDNLSGVHSFEFNEDYNSSPKILKTGQLKTKNLYEQTALLNNASSASYTSTGANNSCLPYVLWADFTPFYKLGQPIRVNIEADVSWSNITPTGTGTFNSQLQGGNYIAATETWGWTTSPTSVICGYNFTSLMTANGTGSVHISYQKTISATWLDANLKAQFGLRTDYATGTIEISNLKITLIQGTAKINTNYVSGNDFIEM